ncbi:MAG: 3-hydroxyacyl-CoA dehydrogenase NAD-binding domain-containing protein [Pseudomonadota bacterium]
MTYHHWKFEQDQQGLCWLWMDRQEKSANTINADVLQEFDQLLDEISQNTSCQGLIIGSAKSSGFIMGADIESFTKLESSEQAYTMIRQAQAVFDKLSRLKLPTVAMIKGFCLGGGTELALACRYRVAEESRKTRIGLPEVKLGIHPGWGGTVRAPGVMGGLKAMDLILSGRMLSGKQAQRFNLVNVAVPERHLKRAAAMVALKQVKLKTRPGLLDYWSNFLPLRLLFARVIGKKIALKARQAHYPAPYAALANWRRFGASRRKAAFEAEARSVSELIVSATARNLIRVFFLQNKMKKLSKASDFKAKHVHVIGAGTMGGDIAAWCALKGMTVTLQDREAKFIAPAIQRARAYFTKKMKSPRAVNPIMDRLIPDIEGRGIQRADVVIEAIFEDLATKQELFKHLETRMKPDAIMATNTSGILLEDINKVLNNKERLVGIHFFNPVTMMPLIEVVQGQQTDQTIVEKTLAFAGQLGKQPIVVKSSPGFLVNRCLMPYLMEAIELLDEGVAVTTIDHAAKDFGMPMGPIELADTVGLDICLHVAENLTQHYGGTVPEKLKQLIDAGHLGKKTGAGFYQFKKGKIFKPTAEFDKGNANISAEDIQNRLILRMVNECAACLREDIIDDKDFVDAGMIFGTGFAPFRGGPMHYADKEGLDAIVSRLRQYADTCGDHFTPDAYFEQIA